jgi:predicted transcriptional regulator of viral defense system
LSKPNYKFQLTRKDIDIIETALRAKVGRRSQRIIEGEDPEILQTEASEINDLLGRLHNQKNWYRPSKGTYVGG